MNPYEYHYDFKFGLANAGYFSITNKSGHITQFANFHVDGDIVESLFEIKHDGKHALECKVGDGVWRSMGDHGDYHFPGCAYPLFLPLVKDEFIYTEIDETTGGLMGKVVLKRSDDTITETRGDQVLREFKMRGDIPVQINWGGPISTLHDSLDNAKANSPIQ